MCVWTIFGDVVGAMFPPSLFYVSNFGDRSSMCPLYAATLTRSTFEDPIGVNFIIMLLYSCTRITPRVCTLVLFIITVIFAENALFTCKLRRHLLALMALTTPKPQNTDTNGTHATWA